MLESVVVSVAYEVKLVDWNVVTDVEVSLVVLSIVGSIAVVVSPFAEVVSSLALECDVVSSVVSKVVIEVSP